MAHRAALLALSLSLWLLVACSADERRDAATRPSPPAVGGSAGRAAATAAAVPSPADYLTGVLRYLEASSVMRDRVEWPALRAEAGTLAQGARTPAETYPAIRHALRRLGDRHSDLLTPEEARLAEQGLTRGLGLLAAYPEGTVIAVDPGSPAAQADVRVGDTIEAVDGGAPAPAERRPALVALDERRETQLRWRRPGEADAATVTLRPAVYSWGGVPAGQVFAGGIGYLELPATVGAPPAYAPRASELLGYQELRAKVGDLFGGPPIDESYEARPPEQATATVRATPRRPAAAATARVARVTTLRGEPARVEELVRQLEAQLAPVLERLAGYLGLYLLVDAETGTARAVALWASAELLAASDAAVAPLRTQAAAALGARAAPSVAVYEVVAPAAVALPVEHDR
jgi:hypothetical protein